MPTAANVPDLERQIAHTIARIEALERKRPGFGPPEAVAAATGGGISSYVYMTSPDYYASDYITVMTEVDRCGPEEVSRNEPGYSWTFNTTGIYTIVFHAAVLGEPGCTAEGWRIVTQLYTAMRPTANPPGNFWGPTNEIPAGLTTGGLLYMADTVTWTGRVEAADDVTFDLHLMGETGVWLFEDINAWIIGHGDCP